MQQDIYDANACTAACLTQYQDKTEYGITHRHYTNLNSIGFIQYSDWETKDGVDRYIAGFDINEDMRGKGIGTQCMQQFIEQSKAEGVNILTLNAVKAE